jgi:hypothetical protein
MTEPCPECEEFRREGFRQPLFAEALHLECRVEHELGFVPTDRQAALIRHFEVAARGKVVHR